MWQRKDFLLITSFRNHYQNNVTFQPLNSIVSVYRGLGTASSPSAPLRHSMIGQEKEFLPRDWEQTSMGPQEKKFIFNTKSDDRIYQNNSGLQDGKMELLEGFQTEATLIICLCCVLQQERFLASVTCIWKPGATSRIFLEFINHFFLNGLLSSKV